uniref:Secreted protein n=1 Tax=Ixodes ricinus TaxID=34613 RepID=V5H7H5_IXORI
MAHGFLWSGSSFFLVIAERELNATQVNHADIESINTVTETRVGKIGEDQRDVAQLAIPLSATRFALANQELKKHTQLLFDLEKRPGFCVPANKVSQDEALATVPCCLLSLQQRFSTSSTKEDEPEEKSYLRKGKRSVETGGHFVRREQRSKEH